MTPVWSPEAIDDLAALRVYIEQDDPGAAQRLALHNVQNVETLLPNNPEMGRPGRIPGHVNSGPYRFTRNPIYLGMMLGLIGLAIAFNSFWLSTTLVPFALVIRYGVKPMSSAGSETSIAATARGYGAGCRGCRPRYGAWEPAPRRSRYAERYGRGSPEGV